MILTPGVLSLLVALPLLYLSIVLHEISHGWVANRFGDPTARHLGRLSLNPLRHIDPFGTILLPLLLVWIRSPILFGWAKPVPINFQRLGHPKRDLIWVGLAGPAANVALAVLTAALLRLAHPAPHSLAGLVGLTMIIMNLVLGFFNLIPIPPLDGSRVLVGLLPYGAARWMVLLEPFGFLILIGLMYCGLIQQVVWPAVIIAMRWLGAGGP